VSYQVEDSAHGGVLEGAPWVVEDLSGVTLRHDARSFFQGNRFLVDPLVQSVSDALSDGVHDGALLDLYAGTGLLGLAMATRGLGPVSLVEGDPWSGRDLVENARALGSVIDAAADTACESVEQFLSRPRAGFRAWIVDPPRTGLSEAVRTALLRDRPRRLVYVSCDVPTLARDVRSLVGGGYHVRSLVGFDMFPGTGHVEAVCVLDLG
jgi:23S rRNA (uracil1939-C5)-methyltransferase